MKRTVVLLVLCTIMLLEAFGSLPIASAVEDTKGVYAEYLPGASNRNGLMGYMANGDELKAQSYQGKKAYIMQTKGKKEQKTMYFSVSGSELTSLIAEGAGVEITVEYFDAGEGTFALMYDAQYIENNEDKADKYYRAFEPWAPFVEGKYAGYCELKNTNLWKTHTFYVRDPKFQKSLSYNSDFYLTVSDAHTGDSTADVAVSKVGIKTMDTKSPARVMSRTQYVGNVFPRDAKIAFESDIISTVNYDFEGEVVFSAINLNDVGIMYDNEAAPLKLQKDGTLDESLILEQKREPISLKAGETVTRQVEFGFNWFGPMTYRVELVDESGAYYTVYDKAFSRVPRNEREELNENLGMSMHYFNMDSINNTWADGGMELLDRAGICHVRGDILWVQTETNRGSYGINKGAENFYKRNRDVYDGRYKMYPIMNGDNFRFDFTFSEFDRKEVTDAFGDYVREFAKLTAQYGVDTFEIINEPNLGDKVPAEPYAQLLDSVWEKTKPYLPDIKLAGPATAETPVSNEDSYIPKVFKLGGLDKVDIVSVHPYNWRFAPEVSGNMEEVLKLKELCARYGKPDVEIWATENGYTTATTNPGMRVIGNDSGEIGQAAYITRFFIMSQAEKVIDKYFIYTMHDTSKRTSNGCRFGITRGTNSPYEALIAKPILIASSQMSRMMNRAECVDKITTEDYDLMAYRFDRPEKSDMIALWSLNERSRVTLSLGAKEITVSDMYGNETKMYSENGIYSFMPEWTVQYIEGDFTDFKQVDETLKHKELLYDAVVGDTYQFEITNHTGKALSVVPSQNSRLDVKVDKTFAPGSTMTGEFTLKADEKTELQLSFYQGDKLYAIASYVITPVDSVAISLEKCEPYNAQTLNRWAVTLKVRNNRNEKSVGGYIKLESPNDVVAELSNIWVSDIPAGKERAIQFYLPEMNEKHKDALSGTFHMKDGSTQYLSFEVDFTIAKYAKNPPNMDGYFETGEWMRGAWIDIDREFQIRQITDWKGVDDLSGKVNLMWDYENLYLAAKVRDNVLDTSAKAPNLMWNNDSLQIGIKCDMETSVTAFNELCISKHEGKPTIYRNRAEGTAIPGLVTNFEGVIRRDEDEKITYYEITIPWTELITKNFEIKPDIGIAFSIIINDNDGTGRRGWIELTKGIGYEKNPALFTKLRLML